eukprot:1235352-Lingulodinium_polyedra.AAC.1
MVDRPLMSIPSVLYEFVTLHGAEVAPIPAEVSEELRVASALALVAQHDWRRPFAPYAYVSDACPSGYSLLETRATQGEQREAA